MTSSILIVDDDLSVARLLALAFSVEGYRTSVVTSGSQALDRLDGVPTDLVLLDVMLPEVDGLTVLTALRENEAWAATKVVVVTALDGDGDVWRGWASGADYYLTKPFELDHVRVIAERLLAGEVFDHDRPDTPERLGRGPTQDSTFAGLPGT